MKKKSFLLIIMLLCVTVIFASCSKAIFNDGPKADDRVIGNGGTAVIKGDYLYFTNAFTSQANVSVGGNKYGKDEPISGIYRTKLIDGKIAVDEDGNPTGAQLLVKQIGGFENSNLYIVGEYLYYVTPKTLNDADKNTLTGLLSFNRIKLDGSDHKELYSTNQTATEYSIACSNTTVYILINIDNNITLVTCDNKVKTSTFAEGVSDIVLPSGELNSDFSKTVFYTKAVTINDDGLVNGNKIMKKNLTGGDEQVALVNGKTYTLVANKNDRLYYTVDSILYSNNFNGKLTQYGYSQYTNYNILDDNNGVDKGVIATYSGSDYNTIVLLNDIQTTPTIKLIADGQASSETYSIISTTNNDVIYYSGSNVYKKNIYDTSAPVLVGTFNLTIDSNTYIDCDGERIYYFAQVEDSNKTYYYLHVATLQEGAQGQFIGVLHSDDILEDEEK